MKKKIIVKHLAESYNLIPKSKHQRTSLNLPDKLKNDVYNFYIRDDISYQLPEKRIQLLLRRRMEVK